MITTHTSFDAWKARLRGRNTVMFLAFIFFLQRIKGSNWKLHFLWSVCFFWICALQERQDVNVCCCGHLSRNSDVRKSYGVSSFCAGKSAITLRKSPLFVSVKDQANQRGFLVCLRKLPNNVKHPDEFTAKPVWSQTLSNHAGDVADGNLQKTVMKGEYSTGIQFEQSTCDWKQRTFAVCVCILFQVAKLPSLC